MIFNSLVYWEFQNLISISCSVESWESQKRAHPELRMIHSRHPFIYFQGHQYSASAPHLLNLSISAHSALYLCFDMTETQDERAEYKNRQIDFDSWRYTRMNSLHREVSKSFLGQDSEVHQRALRQSADFHSSPSSFWMWFLLPWICKLHHPLCVWVSHVQVFQVKQLPIASARNAIQIILDVSWCLTGFQYVNFSNPASTVEKSRSMYEFK